MWCISLIIVYLNLLRRFTVFCDVNSTSYVLCSLKDGRNSDRRIRRRCYRDKACPPPLSKKKKNLTCCHTIWRIVPISFPLYQMQCVSSRTFCTIYHMRFELLCGGANFVTFLYLWVLSDKFLSLTLFPFSPLHQQAYFLPHRLIITHQALVVMAKLHLNLQYFPLCLSTSSCQPHQQ